MIEAGILRPLGAVQLRGGSSAVLSAVNPIPAARELIIETDTGRVKAGDGTHGWNELPYISTPRGSASVVLDDDNIAGKCIDIPADFSDCIEVYVNGLEADLEDDFVIDGEKISWNGKQLDGILRKGDRISLKYNRR